MSGPPAQPPPSIPVVKADVVDSPIKKLIETKHLYPTEYNLSYIQTKDPVTVKIRGEDEAVKSFGINDLQFPGQKLNLCGDGPTKNKVSGIDFFKEKLNSVYESAKNVEFKQSYPLPWENDKTGKYLISEMEILEEKVKYLAILLGKVYINDNLVIFDKTNEEHVRALPSFYEANTIPTWGVKVLTGVLPIEINLIKCLTKLHVLKVESQFKKNLRRWMQGHGKLSEYPEDAINWAPSSIWTNIKQFNNIKSEDLKGLMKFFEKTNPTAYKILKKFSDTVHLRNVNPNIGQGFILEEDILKWKTSTFLELLKKTPPKNDCEAYLFYKHLILKKEPNFDYIYDEKIQEYLEKKDNEALEAELKKKLADQKAARDAEEKAFQAELLKSINEINTKKATEKAKKTDAKEKYNKAQKEKEANALEQAKKEEAELLKPFKLPEFKKSEIKHTPIVAYFTAEELMGASGKPLVTEDELLKHILDRADTARSYFIEGEAMHNEFIRLGLIEKEMVEDTIYNLNQETDMKEILRNSGNSIPMVNEILKGKEPTQQFIEERKNEYVKFELAMMDPNMEVKFFKDYMDEETKKNINELRNDLDNLYDADYNTPDRLNQIVNDYKIELSKPDLPFLEKRLEIARKLYDSYKAEIEKVKNNLYNVRASIRGKFLIQKKENLDKKKAELTTLGTAEEDIKKQLKALEEKIDKEDEENIKRQVKAKKEEIAKERIQFFSMGRTEEEAKKEYEYEERSHELVKQGKSLQEVKNIFQKELDEIEAKKLQEAAEEKQNKETNLAMDMKNLVVLNKKAYEDNDLADYKVDLELLTQWNLENISETYQKEVEDFSNYVIDDITSEKAKKLAYFGIENKLKDYPRNLPVGQFLNAVSGEVHEIPEKLRKIWEEGEGNKLYVKDYVLNPPVSPEETMKIKAKVINILHDNFYDYVLGMYLLGQKKEPEKRDQLRLELMQNAYVFLLKQPAKFLEAREKYLIFGDNKTVNTPIMQYIARMDVENMIRRVHIDDFQDSLVRFSDSKLNSKYKEDKEIYDRMIKMMNDYKINNDWKRVYNERAKVHAAKKKAEKEEKKKKKKT